jgi:predicted metal-dependent hydrolase
MSHHHLPGDPDVPLVLRRSGRARRISLRISQLDGRVTLTLPNGVPEDEALDFARTKETWIRGHLAQNPDTVPVRFGTALSVDGALRTIVPVSGRRIRLGAQEIGVPGDHPGPRLERYLKEMARDRLAGASDHYAAALGRSYSRITMRDTRSRWGSCSSQGALMYSWRLILAPVAVLNYVAAHEVSHLAEMNHSPAFWAQVAALYGDHRDARTWLRNNGSGLHRYRFDRA